MTYNIDIINLSIYHYNNNTKIKDIAKNLNLSIQIIYLWIKKYNYYFSNNIFLTNNDLKNIKKNIPHGLSKVHIFEDNIISYVHNNPGCSLNDILISIPNINISKSSICKILKKNNITRKLINNKILPLNIDVIEYKRKIFKNNINNFYNFISIDETSFCISDYIRYGYSKKGEIINKIYKHKHIRERKTLLSAINKDGFVSNIIIDGTVNKDIYLNFFKSNIELFKNKFILHDNASIHHTKILKDYCFSNNITLIYLPPYTPQFNPIELVFAEIKNNYRKIKHNNIVDDIKNAINNTNQNNFYNYYSCSLKHINI